MRQKLLALVVAALVAPHALAEANPEWTFNYSISGPRDARPQVHGDADEMFFQFPLAVRAHTFTIEDCNGRIRTVQPDNRGPYLVVPTAHKQARVTTSRGLIKVTVDGYCDYVAAPNKSAAPVKPLVKEQPNKAKGELPATNKPAVAGLVVETATKEPGTTRALSLPPAEKAPGNPPVPAQDDKPKEPAKSVEVETAGDGSPVKGCNSQQGTQCLELEGAPEPAKPKDSAFRVEPAKTHANPPVPAKASAAPGTKANTTPPVLAKPVQPAVAPVVAKPVISPPPAPVKAEVPPPAPPKFTLFVQSGDSLRATLTKALSEWGLNLSWNLGRDRLSTRDYRFSGEAPADVLDQVLQSFELKGWLADDSKTLYIVKESDQ